MGTPSGLTPEAIPLFTHLVRKFCYFATGRSAKYNDAYVYLTSTRITQKPHSQTSPNFFVDVAHGRNSVLL